MAPGLRDTYPRALWDARGCTGPGLPPQLGQLGTAAPGELEGRKPLPLACPVPSSGCPAQSPAEGRSACECSTAGVQSWGGLDQKLREVQRGCWSGGRARPPCPERSSHRQNLEKRARTAGWGCVHTGARWAALYGRAGKPGRQGVSPTPTPGPELSA